MSDAAAFEDIEFTPAQKAQLVKIFMSMPFAAGIAGGYAARSKFGTFEGLLDRLETLRRVLVVVADQQSRNEVEIGRNRDALAGLGEVLLTAMETAATRRSTR